MKDISLKIARYLLKNAGRDDVESLKAWQNKSGENDAFLQLMKSIFMTGEIREAEEPQIHRTKQRLLTRINLGSSRRSDISPTTTILKIAAAIALIFSIASISIYLANDSGWFAKHPTFIAATDAGQQSRLTLPDGSMVWLNAASEVTYTSDNDSRNIMLIGEAYFEVEHNPDIPFVVNMNNASITVHGTSFSASSYPASKKTEATLITGSISVKVPGLNRTIDLQPGQKIVYDTGKSEITTKKVNGRNQIAWREGILLFDNESFDELIQKLERFYAVDFIYDEQDFNDIHYTGTLDNLNINQVLNFIDLTVPVKYEIKGNKIKLNKGDTRANE